MSSPRRQSPAVYRRRRVAVAFLAVLVLALVAWGVRALIDGGSEDPDQASQQEPAGSETGSPTDSATENSPDDGEGGPTQDAGDDGGDTASASPEPEVAEGFCAPADMALRASTHQDSYARGVAPLLIMEIENTGSETCLFDVGTREQTFTVSYGGRELFNTAQCGGRGESLEMEFEPGQTERAQLVWPRSDSSEDCSEPAELTTGDYDLTVKVSGLRSEPHTFTVQGVDP